MLCRLEKVQAEALLSRRNKDTAKLLEERKQFENEQQAWRLQKGRELCQTAAKEVSEIWLQKDIEDVKPVLLAEAKKCNGKISK